MFCINQIRGKKSLAYKVASRVETEDGYVTSTEAEMLNENSDDPRLKTEAKCLKVQISHSDMWAADVFYYTTCHDRFVYFYGKIPKENPLINKEVLSQFAEKKILV